MPSALFVTTVAITLDAFLLPFADHFRGSGWRVDALANGATTWEHLEGHFDERFDIEWSRNPLAPHNLFGASARVRDLVRAGGYDIVHVHTPVAAFVARWALRSLPKNARPVVVYTAHGFHFYKGQSGMKNAAFRTLETLAAGWTDYIITINEHDYREARSFSRIEPDRVRLVPGIGIDTARFSPWAVRPEHAADIRTELDIDPDAFVVCMIAEFGPVKRHALALDAIARVTAEDVVLIFVGDGASRSEIEKAATARGLLERVRFTGQRRDVPTVLAASDAGMLVSEREGLARSVLEAMAMGLPVIGTPTRGIADAVGPSAGWIVDVATPDAIAAAIDEAAASPDEARRRGRLARERACAEFAIERIVRDYEELYAEALA